MLAQACSKARLKISLSSSIGPISTKLGTMHPRVNEIQLFLLIWNWFSGERCGPWISYFFFILKFLMNIGVFNGMVTRIVAALVVFVFCNLTPPLLFLLMSEENIVMVQVTTCTQSYTSVRYKHIINVRNTCHIRKEMCT